MLAGLRSRCTTPASCAATRPLDDLLRYRDSARHWQLSLFAQNASQVAALDVRHRDVLDAVDLAEIVDAHDVLVGDLPCEQQLALEPPFEIARRRRVCGDFRANDLECNRDSEFVVPRLVDGAHPAHAQQSNDVIAAAEGGAWRKWTAGHHRHTGRGLRGDCGPACAELVRVCGSGPKRRHRIGARSEVSAVGTCSESRCVGAQPRCVRPQHRRRGNGRRLATRGACRGIGDQLGAAIGAEHPGARSGDYLPIRLEDVKNRGPNQRGRAPIAGGGDDARCRGRW